MTPSDINWPRHFEIAERHRAAARAHAEWVDKCRRHTCRRALEEAVVRDLVWTGATVETIEPVAEMQPRTIELLRQLPDPGRVLRRMRATVRDA